MLSRAIIIFKLNIAMTNNIISSRDYVFGVAFTTNLALLILAICVKDFNWLEVGAVNLK